MTDAAQPADDVTGKPKRRRMASAARRQEFIEKAIEFFAEEGFESSTRGLAKKLGVTQPLLYRYFPSKEDLVSEVYEAVYVNRWQEEWELLLADRSRPLRDRLVNFYTNYTDVIFDDKWMRIFLFSGLKGEAINRRYLQLVRKRILEPIVAEGRAEFGLDHKPAADCELEFVWVMHGGIIYYGIRKLIYESAISTNKSQIIEDAIEAFIAGLRIKLTKSKA